MYPSQFEYEAPATLDEALAALERYGDEVRVLAAGQSLIPLMKLRFAAPSVLVDVNRVDRLGELVGRRVAGDDEHTDAVVVATMGRGDEDALLRALSVETGYFAVGPVCGMTVNGLAASERAVHEGVEHLFCCSGCRTAFLADPGRYTGARSR